MAAYEKCPDEVLDYTLDWSSLLGSETIASSVWTPPDGITVDSDAKTDTTTAVKVSGGTIDVRYNIVNKITTVPSGVVMERTLPILIVRAKYLSAT